MTRELLQQALKVLEAIRADEDDTGSYTVLDDDIRPDADAAIAALRAALQADQAEQNQTQKADLTCASSVCASKTALPE